MVSAPTIGNSPIFLLVDHYAKGHVPPDRLVQLTCISANATGRSELSR
jgi:hypothetical protein